MQTTVHDIVESRFGLDGGAMFGIVPKPLWSRSNPADSQNRIAMTARCLLVERGDRRVLIDAGMGTKWGDKERGIYAVETVDGGLRDQLERRGVDPDSITDLVLTHLHFDHAGGLTAVDESGAVRPTFPRAVHWVQAENWAWAHHPSLRDAGSYRDENFAPLVGPAGVDLRLLHGVSGVADVFEAIPLRGHTPGMQALRFEVGDRTLVYCADLMPTRAHVQLAWVMGYDLHPLDTVREKREVLEQACNHGWILVFGHDPEHGFGVVERVGPDRYRVADSDVALEALEARLL